MFFMLGQGLLVLSVFGGRPEDRPPPDIHLRHPEKVTELVRRSGGVKDLAAKQALDLAISMGRGGVYLRLAAEQYAVLNAFKKR